MNRLCIFGLALGSAVLSSTSLAQPMSLAEVTAAGATPLSAEEARQLVNGAKTDFTLVNGSLRKWTNGTDGTFIASRSTAVRRYAAQGTWSINDDGAYCLTFDWGAMETEKFCRRLYKIEDRYYAFAVGAKPETLSGTYRFSR